MNEYQSIEKPLSLAVLSLSLTLSRCTLQSSRSRRCLLHFNSVSFNTQQQGKDPVAASFEQSALLLLLLLLKFIVRAVPFSY